jgi:peptidoglycan/LPS O-acetylase OafA/YrhL
MTASPTVRPQAEVATPRPNPLAGRVTPFDGFRGILCLIVFAHHLDVLVLDDGRVPGGWVGLEGFFVLSGFLITTLLVVHQERTGTIGYRRFIGRRLVRLWPALVVMVAACIIPARVISHLSWHDIGLSSIAAAGFFTNWTWRIGWPGNEWLGHLWSLGPEVQFYLTLPLLLVALQRLRAPRWVWFGVLGAIAVGSALWRRAVWLHGNAWMDPYVLTPLRLDSLLIGALVALAVRWGWIGDRWRWPLRVATVGSVVLLGWLTLNRHHLETSMYTQFGFTICALAAAVLVVHLVLEPRGWLGRFLSVRPVVVLGRRSYSFYIWHVPVLVFVGHQLADRPMAVRVAFAVAAIAVLTEVSYQVFEKPSLAFSSRLAHRPTLAVPEPAPATPTGGAGLGADRDPKPAVAGP